MRTATVADLRNKFPRVYAFIQRGETVEITKRGHVVAQLVPPPARKRKPKLVKPDFMAQLKEVWGNRVFTAKEVKAMRDAELDGEQG